MKQNHGNPNILKKFASSSLKALTRSDSTGSTSSSFQALTRSNSTSSHATTRSLKIIKNISQRLRRRNKRSSSYGEKTNTIDTFYHQVELHTNQPDVCETSKSPWKDENDQEEEGEKRMMEELEHQLKEIERSKQMDLQNIRDWTTEKKWKLDRKQFPTFKEEAEISQKAIDAFLENNQNSEIKKLEKQNQLLCHEFSLFEKEMDTRLAANIWLRDEYKHRDATLKKVKQRIVDEGHTKETLITFDTQTRILIEECTLQQEAYQKNSRAKQIFYETIENIIELLGNKGTDMKLLLDIIAIADKRENADITPSNGDNNGSFSSLSTRGATENSNDDDESYNNASYKSMVREIFIEKTNSMNSEENTATSSVTESKPLSDYLLDRKVESRELLASNEYDFMNSWDDTNHSYTSVLEDVTSSSTYDENVYIASINPIIEVKPDRRKAVHAQNKALHEIVETPTEKMNQGQQAQRANDEDSKWFEIPAMNASTPVLPQNRIVFCTEGSRSFEDYMDQSCTTYSEDLSEEHSCCSFVASTNPIVRIEPGVHARNTVYAGVA